jgi:hypothetical protein
MRVKGAFSIWNSGQFYISDSLQPSVDTLILEGDYTHAWTSIHGGDIGSATMVFAGDTVQTYHGELNEMYGCIDIVVRPGSTLDVPDNSYVGSGSAGSFTLMPGATLRLSDMQGIHPSGSDTGAIRVLGARNFSQAANYHYYSSMTGPYRTGPGLPDTVRQLIANDFDLIYLSRNVTVTDTLKLLNGALAVGKNRLSLYGQIYSGGGSIDADSTSRLAVLGTEPSPLFIPATVTGLDTLELDRAAGIDLGAPLPILGAYVQTLGKIRTNWLQYRPAAQLVYNKAGADTTTVGEFPISDGPRSVTVTTGGPLYLHEDRTVPGTLSLSQGALVTGGHTLTVDSLGAVTRVGGFVAGNLRRYIRQIDTMVVYDLGTTAAGYTPVRLRPFNNVGAGFVSAAITGQAHPMVSNGSACLRKYWSLSSQALTIDSCRLTLNYSAADFNPPNFTEAAHEAAMAAGRYRHGASPGWAGPMIAARNAGGSGDGGSIVLSHPGSFADTTDFTLGRDTAALWAPYDSSAPAVVSLSPANGQTGVGLSQPVVVGFSEPVTDTSVTFSCSPAVAGWNRSWNANSTSVTLTHVQFSPATQYTFTVTGARDTSGVPMAGSATAVFNTAPVQLISTLWQGGRYQLMSVPAIPADSTAAGLLEPSLGAYGSLTWRMFDYDQQQARYVENPLIRNGRGYWLASANSDTLSVSCTPNTLIMTTLRMEPGWNLVGDPYGTTLAIGGLEVSADTGALRGYDDSSSYVNNYLLRQRMWTYTDKSYDLSNNGGWDSLSPFNPGAQLAPWDGYAVYAVSPCNLHFLINKQAMSVKASPPPIEIAWQLGIDAESGLGADLGLVVGISPQALEGYDRLDAEKPPLVTSQIRAEIPHPEWNQGPCDAYHYDFRPAAGYMEWPLRLRQSDPASRGTLRLTPSGTLGVGQRAYLVDRKLGTALEIAGPTRVSFTGSREFAVVCSDRTVAGLRLKPLAFGMDRLYPNPFGGTATISYQVPKAGRVSLKVYNVAGQLVRTLADGVQEAGYYGVSWNGTSEGLQAAASGMYLVRLVYGNETRTEKLVKIR